MEQKELQIIKELMELLQKDMEYDENDFSDRLGRKKPEVEIELKSAHKMPIESEEVGELDQPDLLDEEEKSPGDDLKRRLLKLRE